jgi:predicted amidohydrolase
MNMSSGTFKLGMGQMLVEGGRVDANLQRAEAMIAAAAHAGCRVIVLPECLDVGWLDESATRHAETIPGARSRRLAASARRHGIFVAAGLTERDGDLCYNAAVLLDPDGRLLLKHRKIGTVVPHSGQRSGVARRS